jgi:hypothetical protein
MLVAPAATCPEFWWLPPRWPCIDAMLTRVPTEADRGIRIRRAEVVSRPVLKCRTMAPVLERVRLESRSGPVEMQLELRTFCRERERGVRKSADCFSKCSSERACCLQRSTRAGKAALPRCVREPSLPAGSGGWRVLRAKLHGDGPHTKQNGDVPYILTVVCRPHVLRRATCCIHRAPTRASAHRVCRRRRGRRRGIRFTSSLGTSAAGYCRSAGPHKRLGARRYERARRLLVS